jgi:hypothetical protein
VSEGSADACQKCGTGLYDTYVYDIAELDEERNCPGCSATYNWEEQDYSENRLMYGWELEYLDELPKRGKK